MNRNRREEFPELKKELEEYERQGIELWLEGARSTSEEIANAHLIKEQSSYIMREYENNERGEVSKIHFDHIKHQ